MAWRISWHLSCDQCKTKATFAGAPSSAVEKKAKVRGWEITTEFRHYCPECAKKRAKERAIISAGDRRDWDECDRLEAES